MSFDGELENTSKATLRLIETYEDIRDSPKPGSFWDVVVLTAVDEGQRVAYELQLKEKLDRGTIPCFCHYHVFADPPGPKAGCGGSTLFVLQELDNLYGSKLNTYRVFLLNAGGQSQRLPSASILGKIFTALPIGKPMYQLLELKLALYLPFLQRMKAGIFHAASDTIEVFDINDDSDWTFEKPGFTAIAHPSSLDIGRTHGVFVLEENGSAATTLAELRSCLRVLQKPSVQTMTDEHAIVTVDCQPTVYTDSCFFFDHDIADTLLEFYRQNAPLECEIDSYGDFLQALGPRATVDYTTDMRNVSKIDPTLVSVRQKIYHLLRDVPLNVILLNSSQFYHLGTMHEYLDHLCGGTELARKLGFSRDVFNRLLLSDPPADVVGDTLQGCLMHNCLPGSSAVARSAVLEYCDFSSPVDVGSQCIISNCTAQDTIDIVIPDRKFMHTVAVRRGDRQTEYVTIVLDISDDLKKNAKSQSEVSSLSFLGQPLSRTMDKLSLSAVDLFPIGSPPYSLWYAQLFQVCDSMSDSFNAALALLQALHTSDMDANGDMIDYVSATPIKGDLSDRMSMADVLHYKDVTALLKYRRHLYDKIESSR